MRKIFLLIVVLLFYIPTMLKGQGLDSVNVYSKSMNVYVSNVIITPDNYKDSDKSYPVVYLLHGYGGYFKSWSIIKPDLVDLATLYQMIFVCPDAKTSWYWDSPVVDSVKYETYVAKELVNFIDSHYRTIKTPKARAVTGLSMGGHGGLWLGIRHQDVYGACGSMSGGLDIRPFPNNWDMKKFLGEYTENKMVWEDHNVMNQLHLIKPGLAIIFDCGTEDFMYKVNVRLHEEMLYMNIKHDFISRPGVHNLEYWNNAIDYQLLFFYKFFKN